MSARPWCPPERIRLMKMSSNFRVFPFDLCLHMKVDSLVASSFAQSQIIFSQVMASRCSIADG